MKQNVRERLRDREREREAVVESGGGVTQNGRRRRKRKKNSHHQTTFYSQQMHPCHGWRNSQDTMLPPNDAPCTSHRRRRRFPRLSRPAKTTSNSTLTNDSASQMPGNDFRMAARIFPSAAHTRRIGWVWAGYCTGSSRRVNRSLGEIYNSIDHRPRWKKSPSKRKRERERKRTSVSRTHTKSLARCKVPRDVQRRPTASREEEKREREKEREI